MKKIIFALPLILFACTKETTKPIESHVIDSHIKSVEMIGDVQKVSYENSDIVVYLTKISETKLSVKYLLNGKSIEAVSTLIDIGNGMKKWSLQSNEGIEYYSFKINAENNIGDFKVSNPIPFEKLFQHSGTQSIETQTFAQCMDQIYRECNQSWQCRLMCQTTLFGAAGCAIGFSGYCGAHTVN